VKKEFAARACRAVVPQGGAKAGLPTVALAKVGEVAEWSIAAVLKTALV